MIFLQAVDYFCGRVADIGCGQGASTIVMAEAYPNSENFGFDYHMDLGFGDFHPLWNMENRFFGLVPGWTLAVYFLAGFTIKEFSTSGSSTLTSIPMVTITS